MAEKTTSTAKKKTARKKPSKSQTSASDTSSFEAQLWEACEAQRGSVNASRYKHPVLGLVFLKYVNDNFEHYRTDLAAKLADPADDYYLEDESDRLDVLEDRDEYVAHNVFWIPTEARWIAEIRDQATQTDIATRIDKVMDAIERENPVLTGVLPKSFAASEIPQRNLTVLIGIVDGITFGREDHDGRDRLGQVYEYFLGKFSGIEGRAGEDYTPRSVVDLLVEMLEPYKGRIYDPCCGSGGMFVQSRNFLAAHGGTGGDISVFGQESNAETWRLAKMNLALHGIDGNLGDRADSSFTADLHPDLRADFIITNPPFNLGQRSKAGWGRDRLMEDPRWKLGKTLQLPPATNANFAWILHFLYHLSPKGYAGFVLANGALSNVNRPEEVAIRKALVDAGVVDCIVSLPTKLFANTGIPVSLWFVGRNRGETDKHRSRSGETLFIDARSLGTMVSRRHRELTEADIAKIVGTYHSFRNRDTAIPYSDIEGFCRVGTLEEIRANAYTLLPSRYVGTADDEDAIIPTAETLAAVVSNVASTVESSGAIDSRLKALTTSLHLVENSDADVSRTLRLGDIATFTTGYSYRSTELVESSDIAMVNLKNFNRHGGFNVQGLKPIQPSAKDVMFVSTGDLLVAKTDLTQEAEVVGRVVRIPKIAGYKRLLASLDAMIVRPKPGYSREFLFAVLSAPEFREHCRSYATGTTVLHLSNQAFLDYEVEVPSSVVFSSFDAEIALLEEAEEAARSRTVALARLREFVVRFRLTGDLGVVDDEAVT